MATRRKAQPVSEEILQWWDQLQRTGCQEARNSLMEHYYPLVKYTAERLHTRFPGEVEVDDLISAGVFGLMDAIKLFDLSRGIKFETYCSQRIRGAILDSLRGMDWVPRLVRSRESKVSEARHRFEAQNGRKPTSGELHESMSVTASEFEKLQRDCSPSGFVSLSRKWYETDGSRDVCEIDVLEDVTSENPVDNVLRDDIQDLVTRGLSKAERLIIVLYYFEELTMKEIGRTLALSESRVSQMHTAIIQRLQCQLESRQSELQPV